MWPAQSEFLLMRGLRRMRSATTVSAGHAFMQTYVADTTNPPPMFMREIEGPYFRVGAPRRNVLLEEGDQPEIVISGRVLNEKGTPIPAALVNVWMSDHD